MVTKKMILTLLLLVSLPTISKAEGNEQEAVRKAGEAAYKQTGMEEMVNKFMDKWTPELVKEYGGSLMFIKAAAVDKQISWKWEF